MPESFFIVRACHSTMRIPPGLFFVTRPAYHMAGGIRPELNFHL